MCGVDIYRSRPGSAAGSPQQPQPQRPRSAGGVETSSRLYSAFTLGSRRRFGGTNFVGSEAERAIWLQERAKCSMRVGLRPVSAGLLRETSNRLSRPPSSDGKAKPLPQIVLEQTGIVMSGEDIDRSVR